eukprot:gene10694-10851_t
MKQTVLPRLWLAAVAVAGAVAVVLAGVERFDQNRCPAWLQKYEQFHKENRGTELAKYLVARAPGTLGIGDNLRGMMFGLRIAAATRRVLLLQWDNPGQLTDFLEPASGMNWTLSGTPVTRSIAANTLTSTPLVDVVRGTALAKLAKGQIVPSQKQILLVQSNLHAGQACTICPDGNDRMAPDLSDDHVCMFSRLFKPTETVLKTAEEHLAALYPGQPLTALEYPAVHLRLGYLSGEERSVNRIEKHVDSLEKAMLAVSCGLKMAQQSGINTRTMPLLMIADHSSVRRFARHGRFHDVVAPYYQATHTGTVREFDSHLLAFVDLYLLSRAKCLLMSTSGFSNVAWWLSGGVTCKQTLRDCHRDCINGESSPFCIK